MRVFLFLTVFAINNLCFAHGDIKIIECHNQKGTKVLRATPVNKGEYQFKIFNSGLLKEEFKKISITMTDTVSEKLIIENLDFTLGKTPVRIKILETPFRKIREGSVSLGLKSFSGKGECFAVY